MSDIITTTEAAAIIGVSARRVLQLLRAGRIPAQKHNRDWLIRRADAEAFRAGPAGWPAGRKRGPRVTPPGP